MEKKIIKKTNRSSLSFVVLFVTLLIMLIILSLGFKFVRLLNASSFTTPSFNILVIDRDASVVHIDRVNGEISIFTIKDAGEDISKLTSLGSSLTFGLPIDGRLTYNKNLRSSPSQLFSFKNVLASLFNSVDVKYSGANSADILKIYMASRGIEKEKRRNIEREKEFLGQPQKDNEEDLLEYFRDETILNEKISIEVINSTDISGFGSRVSSMLENAGYNVILVRNGTENDSGIIDRRPNSSFTVMYLKRFLKFPVKNDKSTPIADVSIIFGKN